MSWLGRLLGRDRPVQPPGSHYILDGRPAGGFIIRLVRADQTLDSGDLKQVGPAFTSEVVAGHYRDWLSGDAPSFSYPDGAA